jgi:hypothetical protein
MKIKMLWYPNNEIITKSLGITGTVHRDQKKFVVPLLVDNPKNSF